MAATVGLGRGGAAGLGAWHCCSKQTRN